MTAPVKLYAVPNWEDNPGVELATAPGATPKEVEESIGLAYDAKTSKWVSPRIRRLTSGKISVADLDDEELVRGQVRDSDGRFHVSPQRRIPAEFHAELMRRIMSRGTDKLRGEYMNAIDVLTEVMNDSTQDAALRVKVAQYIIERLAGKTPDRVEVAVSEKPWEVAMKAIIKEVAPDTPDELDAFSRSGEEDIMDAEVVDDENKAS